MRLTEIKDWKNYDPRGEMDDRVLGDDFRILAAKWASELAGKRTEYGSPENVLATARKTVARILERGAITFHPEGMKPSSVDLLRRVLEGTGGAGIEVQAPEGEEVAAGKRREIASSQRVDGLGKDFGPLVSGGLVYGFVRLEEPVRVGDKWSYAVRDFVPLERPRRADGSAGAARVRESCLQEGTYMRKDWDLRRAAPADLVAEHARIHEEARRFSLETEKQPPEWMIDRHSLVVEELRRRGMEHRPTTELDRLSQKWITESEMDPQKAVRLADLQAAWAEPISLRNPLLSFVGGACVSGWGTDVDVHVNWPEWDSAFLNALDFRLRSAVPPWMRDRVHLVPDQNGPFTSYMPFAELQVVPIPPENRELVRMSTARLSEARTGGATTTAMARASQREDKVELFRFFIQPKGIAGYRQMEVYSLPGLVETVKEKWVKGGEWPKIEADEKFDGFRAQWHHDGKGRDLLWSEDGGDVTARFPTMVEGAKAEKRGFILDVEITGERAGKHVGRSEVSGYAHSGGPADDGAFTANAHDCVWLDGKDLHKEPRSARVAALRSVPDWKGKKTADIAETGSQADIEKAVRRFSAIPGSEGAMLKLWDSPYPLGGFTPAWIKFKKEADIDAVVVEAHRVSGTDAWNYLCAIRGERGELVPVGRTYNVRFEKGGKAYQAPVGSVIRVAFENLNRYSDPRDGRTWYNWVFPRPVEYAPEDGKPADDVRHADELVQATGGLVRSEAWPSRFRVALERMKAGLGDEEAWEDWIGTAYPALRIEDGYDLAMAEAIGEDALLEAQRAAVRDADEDGESFGEDGIGAIRENVEEYLHKALVEMGLRPEDASAVVDCGPDGEKAMLVVGRLEYLEDPAGTAQRVMRMIGPAEAWGDVGGACLDAKKKRKRVRESERLAEQFDEPPAGGRTDGTLWEHHWRGEASVHLDHRWRVSEYLNGVTLADSPEPGVVEAARKELGIEGPVDTEEKASRLEKALREKRRFKFDPETPERHVLAIPKERQPVSWLSFGGKVEPGDVGGTANEPGFFHHVQEGTEKEFGAQKVYFREFFEHGTTFKGRWILRKLPVRAEWRGKVGPAPLAWFAWFAKPDYESQIPYLLTRRGREAADYVPPRGQSGISREWEKKIPAEAQWWGPEQASDRERLARMDLAFNWLAKNEKGFPFRAIKIREAAGDRFALKRIWWKGNTVVRGMPVMHWELMLERAGKVRRFETQENPLFQEQTSGALVPETGKPPGGSGDWLSYEGEIPPGSKKNPNKKIDAATKNEDAGTAAFVADGPSFASFRLGGKSMRGLWVLKREDPGTDLWVLERSAGPGGAL
jgi:hypothetical protein